MREEGHRRRKRQRREGEISKKIRRGGNRKERDAGNKGGRDGSWRALIRIQR